MSSSLSACRANGIHGCDPIPNSWSRSESLGRDALVDSALEKVLLEPPFITLRQTIMEVEHGPWNDHFPLSTGLCPLPLPWLFQGAQVAVAK